MKKYLLLILLSLCLCNTLTITMQPEVRAIKKEFKLMPKYGVAGIKIHNMDTYAVGKLVVFVYKDSALIKRFNKVYYITQQDGLYNIANRYVLLGQYPDSNHVIDFYCLPEDKL